jgi:hypothetical protein
MGSLETILIGGMVIGGLVIAVIAGKYMLNKDKGQPLSNQANYTNNRIYRTRY